MVFFGEITITSSLLAKKRDWWSVFDFDRAEYSALPVCESARCCCFEFRLRVVALLRAPCYKYSLFVVVYVVVVLGLTASISFKKEKRKAKSDYQFFNIRYISC
jgi:hypothetical protein